MGGWIWKWFGGGFRGVTIGLAMVREVRVDDGTPASGGWAPCWHSGWYCDSGRGWKFGCNGVVVGVAVWGVVSWW